MANKNAGPPIRFENGGTLELGATGGAGDTILNVIAGTLQMQDGGYDMLKYKDRGVIQTPVQGDAKESTMSFDVRLNGQYDSGEVMKLLDSPVASGLATLLKVVVKIPFVKGGATGIQFTMDNVYLPQQYQYQAGTEFDTLKITFESKDAFIAKVEY
jgi:hypothetical protein